MSWPLQPDPPRELQVEVTGACNLRCRMCLVRYRRPLGRAEASLPLERFAALLDDLPDLERVTLQGLGEPLLAPDLLAMVELARSRGVEVGFNTNGTLLTRERSRRLIRAGLSWLHVSVDGATRGTYLAIRGRDWLDKVGTNVRGLMAAKAEMGGEEPAVSLVTVAMRHNLDEIPDLVALAARWGVGRLWVQSLSHEFSDTDPAGSYQEIRAFAEDQALWRGEDRDRAKETFARARQTAQHLAVDLRLPRLEGNLPEGRPTGQPGCDWPWRSAYITYDGRAQPCCMVMGSDRAALGRLDEGGFRSLWRSEAYRDFRSRLLGTDPPEVCQGCALYRGVF
jgi:radical SAM protein with 4Fe4S-binding SPASM domain